MSLYVREAGPRDAPAVVFLHGFGVSHTMWHPQVEGLSDLYHCLAPDLPECGNSTDTGPFTLKDASQRVVDVIRERIPDGTAHVVGLSIGGSVALQILRDEPQVLDHLLISGVTTHLPPFLDTLHRLDEGALHLLSRERLVEYLVQQYHIPQAYHNLLLADMRKVKPEALLHVSQEMKKIKLPRERHVPTLIAVGQEEAFVIKHDAYEMRRSLHGARGVLVPGVGHFWNLVAPDLFTKTLRAWIQDEPLPLSLAPLGELT